MDCVRKYLITFVLIPIGGCMAERKVDPVGKPEATTSRVGPQDARVRIESGAALLVCAYESPEKFHKNHLQGAISLQELQSREDSLAKEREIIFYCA